MTQAPSTLDAGPDDPLPLLTSLSGRVWQHRSIPSHHLHHINSLQAALCPLLQAPPTSGIPLVLAELLVSRNVTDPEAAADFLAPTLKKSMPDPFILRDMDRATELLADAILENKKIVIFGDYDVDGATSTALLKRYFAALGVDVAVYIPDRHTEGYGPSIPAFESLARAGYNIIITVDCGTTAFEVFDHVHTHLTDHDITCLVVDHHKAEAKLPKVAALINPWRLDYPTPSLQSLAAVGLCFMLAAGLTKHLREQSYFTPNRPEPDLRRLLDIVAVGTVADVVKLVGLNRVFVSQGLKVLAKRLNPGLGALCDVANLSQRPDAYHLGFVLGPRINAGGRVGQANLGTKLLTTSDTVEARTMAAQLDAYNQERRQIEADVLEQCLEQAESTSTEEACGIIVGGDGWHQGVIGIVASRLKEKYQRPAIVVSFGVGVDGVVLGKGSGRSVDGLDLGALIHKAKHEGLLCLGGGHTMAVGFSLYRDRFDDFRHFMQEAMRPILLERKPLHHFDAILSPQGLTLDLVTSLGRLEPFGMGNPTPRFLIRHAVVTHADIVGKDHVRCRIAKPEGGHLEAIAFRSRDTEVGKTLLGRRHQALDLIVTLRREAWMGREKIKLLIDDIILDGSPSCAA